jgi:hypothetical protein
MGLAKMLQGLWGKGRALFQVFGGLDALLAGGTSATEE